jgi:hypothetical protein
VLVYGRWVFAVLGTREMGRYEGVAQVQRLLSGACAERILYCLIANISRTNNRRKGIDTYHVLCISGGRTLLGNSNPDILCRVDRRGLTRSHLGCRNAVEGRRLVIRLTFFRC